MTGSARLVAEVGDLTGWRRTLVLQETTPFKERVLLFKGLLS